MFLLSDPVYNRPSLDASEYMWPSSLISEPIRTAVTDSVPEVVAVAAAESLAT